MEGSRELYDATNIPKSIVREERRTYGSSGGMTEEQVKRWSKQEEPKNVAEGQSSKTDRVDSEGMYSDGRADDDRYRRGAADSEISTSGGGMSMVAGGFSSWRDAYCMRMGEAD